MASGGYSLAAVHQLLTAAASLAGEHGLQGGWASVFVACGLSSCSSWILEHRLNSCGTWALVFHGRWDLPGLGMESVSPVLAGRFFTTEPPGKPRYVFLCLSSQIIQVLHPCCLKKLEKSKTKDNN